MTYEEKVAKILNAKQRIKNLKWRVRRSIDKRDRSTIVNQYLAELDRAYIKYNQLKLKYWIFI